MSVPLLIRHPDGTTEELSLADVLSQAREFCADLEINPLYVNAAKRDDLRKHARHPRRRHPLDDPAERMKKLRLETGLPHPVTGIPMPPLEPWTSPQPPVGQLVYSKIMHGEDGADLLSAYEGVKLEEVRWLAGVELVTIEGDRIIPLSDAEAAERRAYPGAPVSDKHARTGRYLRSHARGLIMAAYANWCRGRTLARSQRGRGEAMLKCGGIAITAYDLCAEANRIKARRGDLGEHRFLSVDSCRRVIRELLDAGWLTEIEPPKAIRVDRSWRTLPRVLEIADGQDLDDMAALWGVTGRRRLRRAP